MKLNALIQAIQKLSDPIVLSAIARIALKRYQEIMQSKLQQNRTLSAGEPVSFKLKDGKVVFGVIERRGRKNFRVLGENGIIYRVPIQMVKRERERIPKSQIKPVVMVEEILPLVLSESRRLIENSGLTLSIRFKKHVWSTHFRANRHIQYGERCLAYQLTPLKAMDNVGANLRRFRLPGDIPARLAMLICHEVAHAIAHQRYGAQITPHGRQFFTVLEELVDSEFPEIREKISQKINS